MPSFPPQCELSVPPAQPAESDARADYIVLLDACTAHKCMHALSADGNIWMLDMMQPRHDGSDKGTATTRHCTAPELRGHGPPPQDPEPQKAAAIADATPSLPRPAPCPIHLCPVLLARFLSVVIVVGISRQAQIRRIQMPASYQSEAYL